MRVPAEEIGEAQLVLRLDMALLGGAAIPYDRVAEIPKNPLALSIEKAQTILRLGIAGARELGQLPRRIDVIVARIGRQRRPERPPASRTMIGSRRSPQGRALRWRRRRRIRCRGGVGRSSAARSSGASNISGSAVIVAGSPVSRSAIAAGSSSAATGVGASGARSATATGDASAGGSTCATTGLSSVSARDRDGARIGSFDGIAGSCSSATGVAATGASGSGAAAGNGAPGVAAEPGDLMGSAAAIAGGGEGAVLAAASAAACAASAARSGCRARLSSSLMIAAAQGSRIASPIPRSAPETTYIRIERVPIWMSPESVMPGIRRKSFGTSRRLTSFSATRAL
jgi:hypothetical protein